MGWGGGEEEEDEDEEEYDEEEFDKCLTSVRGVTMMRSQGAAVDLEGRKGVGNSAAGLMKERERRSQKVERSWREHKMREKRDSRTSMQNSMQNSTREKGKEGRVSSRRSRVGSQRQRGSDASLSATMALSIRKIVQFHKLRPDAVD